MKEEHAHNLHQILMTYYQVKPLREDFTTKRLLKIFKKRRWSLVRTVGGNSFMIV
jgi:hypothetical protein